MWGESNNWVKSQLPLSLVTHDKTDVNDVTHDVTPSAAIFFVHGALTALFDPTFS